MLPRLLLLSVLVFASVPLVTSEQSLVAGTEHGLERVARQVSIRTVFNQTIGLYLSESSIDDILVILTAPSSRSLEVTSNQQLQYGSNTVVLQFTNGSLIEQVSNRIMVLYDQGSTSIITHVGSAPTPLRGPGTLYYDSNSAYFSRSQGITDFINTQIAQFPYSGVLFEVSPETQGAMQVLRLTVQNDENPPNMPRDVMQITGSTSLPVSNLQSVTYQSNTISIMQGGQQIQSFPNINTLTTYTTVTGNIPINETFMGNANVGNTNNPRGFTGPGQLIVGNQRAFYTTDGGVINSIQDSTVSQAVNFMRVVDSNGVTTELNLQDRLNMNQQMIQLINSVAIPLTGVTSYEIDGRDVIFRDSNNNEVIRATGRDRFSTYFNNQASSFGLPGSDGIQQIQGSTSGILYSNPDTGEVFYSNDQFLNQRIDQMLSQVTDTPPESITTVQYSTSPQGIGSLLVNEMPVVTLSGAQIIDIGQTASIDYSNRMLTIRDGQMRRTFSNIDQSSSIAPPGTFLVFNMSADLSLSGPGRLYINGPNAFFTNDNNLIQRNSEFVQNIPPPSIRTSSITDADGQTAVMLDIGGEPYMTLSNGSLITTDSDEALLYAENRISFVRAPVRVPPGDTVTYNDNTISFGSSNITGIRNFAVLNGRLNVFEVTAPEVFPGGGDIYFNPVTGLAAYTITGDISNTAASTIDARARTRPPIENITRLGVFDNNQFVMYEGRSPRMIPGGGSLFVSGRTGFYSTDSTLNQELVQSSSRLNPVMPSFMNGQIVVVYNNVSIYEFNPGSATRDITLQNFDVFTYENGVLFNAMNPNISFVVSSVTNFNGINAEQFSRSPMARNFTGPGTLLIDTQSGMAFFTNVPGTANIIRETRRRVMNTFRPPVIERSPTPSFATKFPTAMAQFGQMVSVYEGARVTLECRVSVGNPRPTITFLRDGVPIDRNNTAYLIENGNLTIISAMLGDAGRYTCRAQNDVGIDEASTNLTVRRGEAPQIVENFLPSQPRSRERIIVVRDTTPPPDVDPPIVEVQYNSFDQLVVACKGRGLPKATIRWFVDGVEVNMTNPNFIVTELRPGRSILTVNLAGIDTTNREYRCEASNLQGTAIGEVQVNGVEYMCVNSTQFLPCSTTCGGGVQQAVLDCTRTANGGMPMDVDFDQVPSGLFRPRLRLCFLGPCPVAMYEFVVEEFGPCSVSCGCGIQMRNVTCQEVLGNTTTEVSDSVCIRQGLTMPPRQMTCNNFTCPSWTVRSEFGECSATCSGGTRVRIVVCVNATGIVVSDDECAANAMPARVDNCNENIPCSFAWSVGNWDNCDFFDFCQVRDVFCVNNNPDGNGAQVDDEFCIAELRPHIFRSCGGGGCNRGTWVADDFSECSVTCGTGMRTRNVTCNRRLSGGGTGEVIDERFCSQFPRPDSSIPCFDQQCPGACDGEPAGCDFLASIGECGNPIAIPCCLSCPQPTLATTPVVIEPSPTPTTT